MALTSKRKHNVLTIESKIEILNRLAKGESGSSLAKIYNVGKATVSDIKSKRESILQFASTLDPDDCSKKKKTMRAANHTALEDAVYMWFTQMRSLGQPISGPMLCETALDINSKLGGPTDFKASTGWLKNFKTRHGIRDLKIEEEARCGDCTFAEPFEQTHEREDWIEDCSREV